MLIVADGQGAADDSAGIHIHDLGAIGGRRAGRAFTGSLRALRLVRTLRPRLVHFHDPELIPLGLVLKTLGYRVIYDAHEDLPRQILSKHWIPSWLRHATARTMALVEWIAGRTFDGVVAATPTIAKRFPEHKRALVPNFPIGSELLRLNSTPHRNRPPWFVYVGGIAAIRGAREMVAALEHLRDVGDVRLHLAGRFDQPRLADSLARMPMWASSVEHHGFIDRGAVADLLGQARAGLVILQPLRSYMDSLPIKMFEYMSAGIPVIASDFPLWRGIIDDAACGLLVDPRAPDAIADAMRWILDHPGDAEAMGRRGRMAVEQMYNWDRASTALLDLYSHIGIG
ncbi:MAG TPA: glycosyltransferase family 4 protein [Longimicrobiales bacterium]|nr:glycosyltransferase family 4 protein [Longimicrobiales bacterium]